MAEDAHIEKHFTASNTVRDIIIGMSDGLTVPFALAAGLSGAVASSSIIVIAGLAEIVAGSISMGLGGYLAAESDREHYYRELAQEYQEIKEVPEREREEVRVALREYGIADADILPILGHFEKNPDMWAKFMMRNELNLGEPDPKRAYQSAGTIAASYIVGGAIPLLPYIFLHSVHDGLIVSICVTLAALIIFGYVKSKVIGSDPWKGAFRTAVIGTIAASAAYFLAKLIA